ncbi:MAG: outer membrane beta-barrel protein [Flavobacteriaceae bacterium]
MGKKNLDKLFQEKFTNFSAVPDNAVWQRIEASLDKKKKNRITPLWWKLGGIAALLAILLYAINPLGKEFKVDQKVTEIEKVDPNNQEKTTVKEDAFEIRKNENTIITDSGTLDTKNDTNNAQDVKESITSYTGIEKGGESQSKQAQKDKGSVRYKNHTAVKAIQITDIAAKDQSKNLVEENTSPDKDAGPISNVISESLAVSDNEIENKEIKFANTDLDKNKLAFENSAPDSSNRLKKEGIAKEEADYKNSLDNPKKKSIFDEIKEQEENTELAVNTRGKWSVGANVAPVYFNGFGEGSPVHSIFTSNSKSGNINLSYGLSVSYVLSKKLSIRSGINKVDYGYNTNDVEFTSSFGISGDGQIANIDYTAPAVNLVLESKIGGNVLKDTFAEVAGLNSSRDGVMAQQFGYLEIPVELNYALLDKKFGVSLIGGISSLFLVNNSVAVTSGELTTEIGEANNLNTVNFSTNIGFGVSYNFSPNIKLNIEPVFKYQLNTFSNTAGSFRPFSAGIYSGLNFKF